MLSGKDKLEYYFFPISHMVLNSPSSVSLLVKVNRSYIFAFISDVTL